MRKSGEITKISKRINKASTNSIGVSGDRSDNTAPSTIRFFHIIEKKVYQQKVSKMVDSLIVQRFVTKTKNKLIIKSILRKKETKITSSFVTKTLPHEKNVTYTISYHSKFKTIVGECRLGFCWPINRCITYEVS